MCCRASPSTACLARWAAEQREPFTQGDHPQALQDAAIELRTLDNALLMLTTMVPGFASDDAQRGQNGTLLAAERRG